MSVKTYNSATSHTLLPPWLGPLSSVNSPSKFAVELSLSWSRIFYLYDIDDAETRLFRNELLHLL